jgi:hypothetical protein
MTDKSVAYMTQLMDEKGVDYALTVQKTLELKLFVSALVEADSPLMAERLANTGAGLLSMLCRFGNFSSGDVQENVMEVLALVMDDVERGMQ